jgi:hypothetical protein
MDREQTMYQPRAARSLRENSRSFAQKRLIRRCSQPAVDNGGYKQCVHLFTVLYTEACDNLDFLEPMREPEQRREPRFSEFQNEVYLLVLSVR